jgi:thiamine-phosphate diphosphorylase
MICLVTDRRRLSSGTDAVDRLVELVEAAVRAGVDLIQVRERDLDAHALVALVRRCLAGADGTGTKVVVNDRADVAAAAGAGGVHLRGDSIGVRAVRSLLGDGAVIGRSVHSADEARLASDAGVDYLIFGTMFPTSSKDDGHPVATFDQLRQACDVSAGVPVLAIGGITVERAADLARCGAAGIAAVGLFVPPPGISADRHLRVVTARLRRSFDTCAAVT